MIFSDLLKLVSTFLSDTLGVTDTMTSVGTDPAIIISFLADASANILSEIFTSLCESFITLEAVRSMKLFWKLAFKFDSFRSSYVILRGIEKNPNLENIMLEAFRVVFARQVEEFGFSFACLACALSHPRKMRHIKCLLDTLSSALPAEYRNRAIQSNASAESCFCPECGSPLQRVEGSYGFLGEAMISKPLHAGVGEFFMRHLCDLSLSTDGFVEVVEYLQVTLDSFEFEGTGQLQRVIAGKAHIILLYKMMLCRAKHGMSTRTFVHWEFVPTYTGNAECLHMLLTFLREEIPPLSQAETDDAAAQIRAYLSALSEVCANQSFPAKQQILAVIGELLDV